MSESQPTIDDYDQPDEPTLPLEEALDALRDGVGDGYGARITPAANFNRVVYDLYPDIDTKPLNFTRIEHDIWRYKLDVEKVRETVKRCISEYSNRNSERIIRPDEAFLAIRVAGKRRKESNPPYND